MRTRVLPAVLVAVALLVAACGGGGAGRGDRPTTTGPPAVHALDEVLRVNHLQAMATHNSYHVAPDPALVTAVRAFQPDFGTAAAYTHAPLATQLADLGVRGLELDVYHDPAGGLYADRHGLLLLGQDPHVADPALAAPGFKVLHGPDLDFGTTCLTLVACLEAIEGWSAANPGHAPLLVLVEVKESTFDQAAALGWTQPVPVDAAALDALDAEIRSVFAPERLLVPDDVRGGRSSLDEAVRLDGWPTLAVARGRVLFALVNDGRVRDAYLDGHPALERRVLFVRAEPGTPAAAVFVVDDPVAEGVRIRQLVDHGYLVRTRADADLVEPTTGDTGRRDAAYASGAQWVATDAPVAMPGTTYAAPVPGGHPLRCNPVTAPPGCTARAVEDPVALDVTSPLVAA